MGFGEPAGAVLPPACPSSQGAPEATPPCSRTALSTASQPRLLVFPSSFLPCVLSPAPSPPFPLSFSRSPPPPFCPLSPSLFLRPLPLPFPAFFRHCGLGPAPELRTPQNQRKFPASLLFLRAAPKTEAHKYLHEKDDHLPGRVARACNPNN